MTEKDKLTEEKIFDSATEIFIKKGFEGARMQDIAEHAGINKSLLHYYYRTKERLFNAVFENITDRILKKLIPVFDENLSLEEKIRLFFREHIDFLYNNQQLPVFIFNEINRKPAKIKKLLKSTNIMKIWTVLETQHSEELIRYNITPESLPQLMTSIAAMSIFPFVAKNIITTLFEKQGCDFDDFIEKRKEYAAEFVIRAIKN
ncbi:MAG: TetR/AcrR family transcriptional regulator [Bacteroidales bacterium]|nr:TetR/AcrR family transcriptional regulator [Bacteroidales bacterium]